MGQAQALAGWLGQEGYHRLDMVSLDILEVAQELLCCLAQQMPLQHWRKAEHLFFI